MKPIRMVRQYTTNRCMQTMHTQKDASSSPEGVPITIKTVWDKGSSDLGSVDNFCSVNIGLGGSTFQSVFESAANIVKSFQIVKFYFNL